MSRKRRDIHDGSCVTSDDCDNGGMCNMDLDELGGSCESCPGNTDNDCYGANFLSPLATDECREVCVGQESENAYTVISQTFTRERLTHFLKFLEVFNSI